MATGSRIQEGEHVILDVNNERQSCVKIKQNAKLKVGKAFVSLHPLIGEHFGSLFEVSGSPANLQKRKRVSEIAGEDWDSIADIDRNNSKLEDKGIANQALTTADIELLRKEGKTGDEIVAALTENSATFQQKTQFSQEKYMRKKAKKYTTHVTAIRPTAHTLAEFYFRKVPVKTGWLRSDSLAILLSMANISAHSRTLVVDGTGGLVAGAALERTGGHGSIVNAFVGDRRPSTEIVSLLNLPEEARKGMIQSSIASLRELHQSEPSAVLSGSDGVQCNDTQPAKRQKLEIDAPKDAAAINGNAGSAEGPEIRDMATAKEIDPRQEPGTGNADMSAEAQHPAAEDTSLEELQRKQLYEQQRLEKMSKLQELCRQGFQSCIIAHPTADPATILTAVLPLLAPSASFAAFFPVLQPLAEAMNSLIKSKEAIAMQLQESWWRPYQVLPGRTHPMMSTSGSGGYILSGTKVAQ